MFRFSIFIVFHKVKKEWNFLINNSSYLRKYISVINFIPDYYSKPTFVACHKFYEANNNLNNLLFLKKKSTEKTCMSTMLTALYTHWLPIVELFFKAKMNIQGSWIFLKQNFNKIFAIFSILYLALCHKKHWKWLKQLSHFCAKQKF